MYILLGFAALVLVITLITLGTQVEPMDIEATCRDRLLLKRAEK